MATSTERHIRALDAPAVIVWSLAAALLWGCIDVSQVVVTTGGQQLLRLAAMVASLYAMLGLLGGALLAAITPRLLPTRLATTCSVAGLALVCWGTLLVGTYVNVVHLPSITSPVTMVANVVLVVSAIGLWRLLAGSAAAARCAESRRLAAAVAGLAFAGCLLAARGWASPMPPIGTAAASDKPNVFVIVIDTLRYDRTGLGLKAASKTPNLDRLAGEGTAFERAYAQASWTKPSAASLFTSLYPSSHGANLRRDRLSGEPLTIAELLARNGYRTAVFSANPWISPAFGFDQGVEYFYQSEPETFSRLVVLLQALRAADRVLPGHALRTGIRRMEDLYGLRTARATNCERDGAIVEAFAGWLASRPEQPGFAYFHLMSPHIPYQPPGVESDFAAADQVALLQQTDALASDRRALLLSLYDQTVAYADQLLGEIVSTLRARGILDQSVLIVSADHGEEFHEHGRWGHGKSLYDEVVRVPLVLRGPGVAAGVTAPGPAMLVDVLPTIAALLGLPADALWEGSILGAAPADRTAYAELIREGGLETYMIYRNGRKYLEIVDGLGASPRRELYDLDIDAREARPVVGSEDRDWQNQLAAIRESARSKRLAGGEALLDEAAQEKLEALGYLN